MHYHPDLAATVAEARTADFHAAAARGRHDAREGDASHTRQPPSPASIQLDAYPRLCGLPVTIERLTTSGARQADAAGNQGPSNLRNQSAPNAAEKQSRRRSRLLGGSKRSSGDGDPTYWEGQHSNRSARRKRQGSPL